MKLEILEDTSWSSISPKQTGLKRRISLTGKKAFPEETYILIEHDLKWMQ